MSARTPVQYVSEREPDREGFGHVAIHAEFEGGATEPVQHVVYHSPTGLEYGYGGSGPADTALSILAHFYGADPKRLSMKLRHGRAQEWTEAERRAIHFHQDFKRAFIANTNRAEPLVVHWGEVARFSADQLAGEGSS